MVLHRNAPIDGTNSSLICAENASTTTSTFSLLFRNLAKRRYFLETQTSQQLWRIFSLSRQLCKNYEYILNHGTMKLLWELNSIQIVCHTTNSLYSVLVSVVCKKNNYAGKYFIFTARLDKTDKLCIVQQNVYVKDRLNNSDICLLFFWTFLKSTFISI